MEGLKTDGAPRGNADVRRHPIGCKARQGKYGYQNGGRALVSGASRVIGGRLASMDGGQRQRRCSPVVGDGGRQDGGDKASPITP